MKVNSNISIKKVIFEEFYHYYQSFYCIVAARVPNVSLPEELLREEFVKLEVGSVPVVDMVIDDEGISATMTFNRYPFHVFLPWESIVTIDSDSFTFGQKFSPYENVNHIQPPESPKTNMPEKAEIVEDEWITKDTKYSHLKLLTKRYADVIG